MHGEILQNREWEVDLPNEFTQISTEMEDGIATTMNELKYFSNLGPEKGVSLFETFIT